ncbi:MAG: molecular chaperone TorD family protein [Actinomycetota bacterium]
MSVRSDDDHVSGVPAAQHAVYRVLGSLFLPPEPDRLARLVAAAPELERVALPLEGMTGHRAWTALVGRLGSLEDDDVDRMRTQYTGLFLSGSRDLTVQPFESSYAQVSEYDIATVSAAVETRYRRAGIQLASKGELPDHVAVELEFCAYLCHQEGDADTDVDAARWRAERQSFLIDHLVRWLPDFAGKLARVMPESVYTEAAAVVRAVTADDLVIIDALAAAPASG